jgi:hypothetical protein
MKTLSDFPEFLAAKKKHDEIEAAYGELVVEREGIISRLRASLHSDIEAQAGELVQTGALIDSAPPRERIAEIDRTIRIHQAAIEQQRGAVEKVRGQVSLELCQQVLPDFEKDVEESLQHLKALCSANQRVIDRRHALEQSGVVTGSIPCAIVPQIGTWGDQFNAGIAQQFQAWVKQDFPRIKI